MTAAWNPIPITPADVGRYAVVVTSLGLPMVVRVLDEDSGAYAWGIWEGRPCRSLTRVAAWFDEGDVCIIDDDRCLVLRDGRVVELTGDEARAAMAAQGEE